MKTWIFNSPSEDATQTLGGMLAGSLRPNTTVALVGDLGSGKTRLIRAIATAMGADAKTVTSPTFVLIQEYEADLRIYHIDAYRLKDSDEFLELGAEELMQSDGVCLIEWADRVADVLPSDFLRIEIEATGETSREFRFRGSGPRSDDLVRQLRGISEQPEADALKHPDSR